MPHLITHVETVAATSYDGSALEPIHTPLEAKGLLPDEHIVDSGYLGAEALMTAKLEQGITLLGPVPEDWNWQARKTQAFDLAQFHIDWQAHCVTCPEGKTSRHWIETYNRHGKEVVHAKFSPTDCRTCPSRSCCTRAKAGVRHLTFHPDALQHQALQYARQRQRAPDFKAKYAKRAGIEGTISESASEDLTYVMLGIGDWRKRGYSINSSGLPLTWSVWVPGSWKPLWRRPAPRCRLRSCV